MRRHGVWLLVAGTRRLYFTTVFTPKNTLPIFRLRFPDQNSTAHGLGQTSPGRPPPGQSTRRVPQVCQPGLQRAPSTAGGLPRCEGRLPGSHRALQPGGRLPGRSDREAAALPGRHRGPQRVTRLGNPPRQRPLEAGRAAQLERPEAQDHRVTEETQERDSLAPWPPAGYPDLQLAALPRYAGRLARRGPARWRLVAPVAATSAARRRPVPAPGGARIPRTPGHPSMEHPSYILGRRFAPAPGRTR